MSRFNKIGLCVILGGLGFVATAPTTHAWLGDFRKHHILACRSCLHNAVYLGPWYHYFPYEAHFQTPAPAGGFRYQANYFPPYPAPGSQMYFQQPGAPGMPSPYFNSPAPPSPQQPTVPLSTGYGVPSYWSGQ
jgi:hypothetical protein